MRLASDGSSGSRCLRLSSLSSRSSPRHASVRYFLFNLWTPLEPGAASAFQAEAAIVEKSDPRVRKHLYRIHGEKESDLIVTAIPGIVTIAKRDIFLRGKLYTFEFYKFFCWFFFGVLLSHWIVKIREKIFSSSNFSILEEVGISPNICLRKIRDADIEAK